MEAKEKKPALKEKIDIKPPRMFKIILFNDDFTPFFFVEKILSVIYNKNELESQAIAHKIHTEGSAVIGVYTQEIAQTKHAQTMYNAKQNNYPLHCEIEPED